MKTFVEFILSFIEQHSLLPTGSTVVVGLSGGPDSVFLLHLLLQLQQEKKLTLIAAHLDHEWREDSYKDVIFCQKLTRSLDVPFVSMKRSELPQTFTGSLEEQGRHARRAFFQIVKKEYQADAIALAHHEQDQQETFFIRLIRGASLTGLTAMKPAHDHYIRPLLRTSKSDIISYLDTHNIAYLTDPTNSLPYFLRNRIRTILLPACRKTDARFDRNFLRSLDQLQETEEFLAEITAHTLQTISTADSMCAIRISELLALHPVLQKRVLFAWLWQKKLPFVPTQAFGNEIIRFLHNTQSTTHRLSPTWSLVKKKNILSIQKHS